MAAMQHEYGHILHYNSITGILNLSNLPGDLHRFVFFSFSICSDSFIAIDDAEIGNPSRMVWTPNLLFYAMHQICFMDSQFTVVGRTQHMPGDDAIIWFWSTPAQHGAPDSHSFQTVLGANVKFGLNLCIEHWLLMAVLCIHLALNPEPLMLAGHIVCGMCKHQLT